MEQHSRQSSDFEESGEKPVKFNYDENVDTGRHLGLNSIPHYSEQEAKALEKKLLNEETFEEAQETLITWLERGEFPEKNFVHFRFLVQFCLNRAGTLLGEHKENSKNIEKDEECVVSKSSSMRSQLNTIKAMQALEKLNLCGNFSQNQKEKLQEILKDSIEIKNNFLKDNEVKKVLKDCINKVVENQELNDIEDVLPENKAHESQAEFDNLTYELNTARQKAEELKEETKKNENEILKLRAQVEELSKLPKKTDSVAVGTEEENPNLDVAFEFNPDQKEMCLISLISVLLFNHPDGVNLNGIHSFINEHFPTASAGELENFLRRHPNIFEESLPIGATQETRWICISIDQRTFADICMEMEM